MDDLGLVQYLVHAPPAILQVLGVDTAQGPPHLCQDEGLTIQFPQVEDTQSTLDHQEVLEGSEMLIMASLILQVMTMLLIKMKMAMDIARNLHTRLRKREVTGGHRLEEYQDHPLDLGLGLLTCHLGAADNGKAG